MSKRCFRRPFSSHRANGSEALLKPQRQHFFPIISSSRVKLIWKTSPLVGCQILGLPVDTLIIHDKYGRHNKENFRQPIQVHIFHCVSQIYINF